jgi:hypothetical protein
MTNRIWRGGISGGSSRACDECGAPTDMLFEIGGCSSACRSCVLDPVRQIGTIDRRGDVLQGARIARELDAQTAITLHLHAQDRRDSDHHGGDPPLPPLPASYKHVLAALDRCRRVDADFSTAITELRERYEQAAFFGPKQMLLVQWRLSENGVTHDPGCFVVSTRSDKEIAQIRGFDDWRKKKIAPYLSWQQRGRWGF